MEEFLDPLNTLGGEDVRAAEPPVYPIPSLSIGSIRIQTKNSACHRLSRARAKPENHIKKADHEFMLYTPWLPEIAIKAAIMHVLICEQWNYTPRKNDWEDKNQSEIQEKFG